MRDGLDGLDGADAYEIARQEGFRGARKDWLAELRGKDGAPGPTGAQGPPGRTGKAGEIGPSGAQGPDGERGPEGQRGPAGEQGRGIEFVEVKNGDLIVYYDDGTEQNVGKIVGPEGKAGENRTVVVGSQGPQGERGPPGESGGGGDPSTIGSALYEAGEDVIAFAAISVMPDETVGYSMLDEPERIFGLSLETKATGEQVRIKHAGIVVNPAWSWTPGGPVYALDSGGLSQTSDPAVSARLGLALTATSILVRGEPPIFIT